MKRKLLGVLCVFMMLTLAGCANYGSIESELEQIKIEIKLPKVSEGKFTSLEEANDAIYEQQIAACSLYSESYEKTYYKQFLEDGSKLNADKVASLCNTYRRKLNEEISTEYYKNIYKIVKNCDDCTNKEAFLEKTNNDVQGFYDAYTKYMDSENPDEELCDILVNYAERRNVFALSFLDRNRNKVYDASVKIIEQNADAEDDFRFYLNKNNNIITALNEVYDGVPQKYAKLISESTTKLSKNLLNSLESLTDRERDALMEQLNLSTPTPSPKPTATVRPTPSPTPERTPSPQTQAPTRTAVPSTQAPVRTATPATQGTAPTAVPQTTQIPEEQTQETDLPSYSFSVND